MSPHLISDQSENDIQRSKDEENLKQTLREMASNTLRIVRGAGSPYIGRQAAECVDAFERYRASHGHYPPFHLIQKFMDPDYAYKENRPWVHSNAEDMARWGEDGTLDRENALLLIRKGALQVAASKLSDQLMQERRGEEELSSGIRALEEARAQKRAHSTHSLGKKSPKDRG
jgi:hypothetical protein